jgi:AraC family transcriptional regulator, ethanolamine operon transcriptional activator
MDDPKKPLNPYILKSSFNDFDEYGEQAIKWNIEHWQLEKGEFHSKFFIAGTNRMQFATTQVGRRLIQKGTTPSNFRTFGLLAHSNIEIYWRGKIINGSQVFLFPPDREIDAVLPSNFCVFVVSLTPAILEKTCISLGIPDFYRVLEHQEVFSCDKKSLAKLRSFLFETEYFLNAAATNLHPDMFRQLEEEASYQFINAISKEPVHSRKVERRRSRDIALTRAINFIETKAFTNPGIAELCTVSHASERTLDYAFKERYGISPKAFVNSYRLNEVKKTILTMDASRTKIHEVAESYGFWHKGKFAADYKALFGELPSQTLKRNTKY